MLRISRNDHDVALAADPLFAAEAEVDLALQHPRAQLIYVTALNSRLALWQQPGVASSASNEGCKNIRLSSDVANPVEQEPTLAGE